MWETVSNRKGNVFKWIWLAILWVGNSIGLPWGSRKTHFVQISTPSFCYVFLLIAMTEDNAVLSIIPCSFFQMLKKMFYFQHHIWRCPCRKHTSAQQRAISWWQSRCQWSILSTGQVTLLLFLLKTRLLHRHVFTYPGQSVGLFLRRSMP